MIDLGNNWGNFQHRAVHEITPIGDRWDEMVANMTESGKEFLMGYVNMAKGLAAETGTFLKTALQVIDDPEFRAKLEALLTKIESVGTVGPSGGGLTGGVPAGEKKTPFFTERELTLMKEAEGLMNDRGIPRVLSE